LVFLVSRRRNSRLCCVLYRGHSCHIEVRLCCEKEQC
jgi:hypothetical protein